MEEGGRGEVRSVGETRPANADFEDGGKRYGKALESETSPQLTASKKVGCRSHAA